MTNEDSERVIPLPLAKRICAPKAEDGNPAGLIRHLAFQAVHLPNTLSKSQIEQLGLYVLSQNLV